MEIIIVIVLLVLFSSVTTSTKRRAEEAKRKAQQWQYEQADAQPQPQPRPQSRPSIQPTVRPTVTAPAAGGSTWTCACGNHNMSGANYCRRCGRPRAAASGSMAYDSAEGSGSRGSLGTASAEGVGFGGSMGQSAPQGPGRKRGESIGTSLRHAVHSITESTHGHIESSMTGLEGTCEEGYALDSINDVDDIDAHSVDAYAISTAEGKLPFGMRLDEPNAVVQGVLYAEILGKPKAARHIRF